MCPDEDSVLGEREEQSPESANGDVITSECVGHVCQFVLLKFTNGKKIESENVTKVISLLLHIS